MADIKVRIQVNEGGNSESVDSVASDRYLETVNTSYAFNSSGIYNSRLKDGFEGSEGLSFNNNLYFTQNGALSNNDNGNGKLQSEKNPRQFVWGLTDLNGSYDMTITISGSGIDSIVLVGDNDSKQFPIEAYLDGSDTPIYSDDFMWDIKFPTKADSHTIRITKWNVPNYNAVITTIRVMLEYLELGKRDIQSLKTLSESNNDARSINYGVLANSGDLHIIDNNERIKDMINDGIMPNSNVNLEIYVNNKLIQSHITTDSDYNSVSKEVSISMTNNLERWGKINYPGYPYPEHTETAYNMLSSVLETGGYSSTEIIEMLSPMKSYLDGIVIEYPYLKPDTLLNTVNKFCTLAQMSVYMTNDNKPLFVSSRPVIEEYDIIKAIRIPKSAMYSEPENDVLLKNKYKAVEINENKMEKVIDYRATLANDGRDVHLNSYPYIKNNELSSGALSIDTFVENLVNNGTMSTYCNEKKYYETYTINVNKYSNFNLNKALRILKQIDYSIEREKRLGSCRLLLNLDTGTVESIERDKTSSGDIPYLEVTEETGEIKTGTRISVSGGAKTLESLIPENDESGVILSSIIDNGDYYTITYKVLTSFERISATYRNFTNSGTVYMYGYYEKYTPYFSDVEILGENQNIETKEISESDSNLNTVETFARVESNELIQTGTTYNGTKISDVIKTNIKRDYRIGVATTKLKIGCQNMYYRDGTLAKDFSKGETLNLGNIVFFTGDIYQDKTQRYWRIISSNFIYDNEPMLELVLQEVIILTWNKIAEMSHSGVAQNYLSIGEEKTFKLTNGEEVTMQIVGFNHDTLSDNTSNKAGITFGMKNLLNETVGVSRGNYETSTLREKILSIFELFPEDLKQYIKEVRKSTLAIIQDDGLSGYVYTNDKLWAFSENEIFGTDEVVQDGKQYDYWKSNSVFRIKKLSNGSGDVDNWWLRTGASSSSVTSGSTIGMKIVKTDGTLGSITSLTPEYDTRTAGICFGFCI